MRDVQPTATSSRSVRTRQRPREYWLANSSAPSIILENPMIVAQPDAALDGDAGSSETGDQPTSGKVGRPRKRPADTPTAANPPKKRKTKPAHARFSKPVKKIKSPVTIHLCCGDAEDEAENMKGESSLSVQVAEANEEGSLAIIDLDSNHSEPDITKESQRIEDSPNSTVVCSAMQLDDPTKATITPSEVPDSPFEDEFFDTLEIPTITDKTGSHRSVSMIVIMRLDKGNLELTDSTKKEAFLQMLMLEHEALGLMVQRERGHGEERFEKGLLRRGGEAVSVAGREIWGFVARLCEILGGG
ncbi:hypothetical protein DL98DRAFT_586806 [Cadophora sp. DSE1049]|nr:hypothetical protein DL98DRAFT_586806 [Cadophora sp. DSE1049]